MMTPLFKSSILITKLTSLILTLLTDIPPCITNLLPSPFEGTSFVNTNKSNNPISLASFLNFLAGVVVASYPSVSRSTSTCFLFNPKTSLIFCAR